MTTTDRLYRQLPAAYVIWALPLLGRLCWLIPPRQAPDEPAHLARADQIAHGGLPGHCWVC